MKLFGRKKETRQFFPYFQQSFSSGLFSAELNGAVDTAVSKIANTVSILPITLYAHTKNGKREAFWNPVYRLLRDPAVEESSELFYKTLIRHLLMKGNAYIFKHKVNGEVLSLELIEPNTVRVDRNHNGRKLYTIIGERGGVFTDNEIIHIPYTGEGYNGTIGRSPVDVHQEKIRKNDIIDEYIRVFFKNGIGSRLLVELDDKFEAGSPKMEKLMQEFKVYFNQFVLGAENAGSPIITPPNTKISKIEQSNNVQGDVQKLFDNSTAEIYRLFNIPPEVLMSSENKYGSLEQKNTDFLISCIQPLCKHISEVLTKGLLKDSESSLFIAFDYLALQETDLSKKMDYYLKAYHGGLITLNEFRAAMNMGSVENEVEGNTRLVPSNLIPWTEDNIEAILAKSKLALQDSKKESVNDTTEAEKNIDRTEEHIIPDQLV